MNIVRARTLSSLYRQPRTTFARNFPLKNKNILPPLAVSTFSVRGFSSVGKVGEGSHSDFQKQSKVTESKKEANETEEIFDVQKWLGKVVKEHPVVLFMKGSPELPQCGFSLSVVNILKEANCEFASADVLQNEELRAGLKVFSNWPTFPQLYIGGEFIENNNK